MINSHSTKFWLCIAVLAAGVALLIFSHGDVALQVAGGTTVTAAIGFAGQVIRKESREDSAMNAARVQVVEEKAVVAKDKAEAVEEKIETVQAQLEETAHNLKLEKKKK